METGPHIFSELICYQNVKLIQRGKESVFNKSCFNNWFSVFKINKCLIMLYIEINLKRVTWPKPKIQNHTAEENTEYCHDLGVSKYFLGMTPKTLSIMKKMYKLDSGIEAKFR